MYQHHKNNIVYNQVINQKDTKCDQLIDKHTLTSHKMYKMWFYSANPFMIISMYWMLSYGHNTLIESSINGDINLFHIIDWEVVSLNSR